MNTGLALAIALAAAVGAPARFLLDRWVTDRFANLVWSDFPWGLLVVNSLGSLVAGLALVLATPAVATVVLVGLCGAFTTFSGFGWDLSRLWQHRSWRFWAAVVVMPAACIAAFMLGSGLGNLVAG